MVVLVVSIVQVAMSVDVLLGLIPQIMCIIRRTNICNTLIIITRVTRDHTTNIGGDRNRSRNIRNRRINVFVIVRIRGTRANSGGDRRRSRIISSLGSISISSSSRSRSRSSSISSSSSSRSSSR